MENYEIINEEPIFEYHSASIMNDNMKITNMSSSTMANSSTIVKKNCANPGENDGLCRVCSDISTGKHYGQMSCEGCKSFFKRSIRRKVEYVCKNNGKCNIYKEMRNQCQACRFHKCQKIGMKKDSVQNIRYTKSQSPNRKEFYSNKIESTLKSQIDAKSNDNWDEQLMENINLSSKTVLNSILDAENAAPIHCVDNFVEQSMGIICSIAAWSKKLLFSEHIEVTDKVLLLKNSWCQLFILNYALCGLSSKLIYSGNSTKNSFYFIQNQLLALNRLPMDAIECGCLKAIIFFNPDTQLLYNCSMVDKVQRIFQEALDNHVGHNSADKSRFGKLLLRLPYLKEVKVTQILEVFFNDDTEDYANFINEILQKLLTTTKSNKDNV